MDKYNQFLDEYERLCRETGYYFDITEGNGLGIFYVASNEEDFAQHIADFRGGRDD